MYSDPSKHGSEWLIPDEYFKADYLSEAHTKQVESAIEKVADNLSPANRYELSPARIDYLIGLTTQSMLDNGLVDEGVKHTVYDTGEERTVSDLLITSAKAKEETFAVLGIDEQGDWAYQSDSLAETKEFMKNITNQYQARLLELFNTQEVNNG